MAGRSAAPRERLAVGVEDVQRAGRRAEADRVATLEVDDAVELGEHGLAAVAGILVPVLIAGDQWHSGPITELRESPAVLALSLVAFLIWGKDSDARVRSAGTRQRILIERDGLGRTEGFTLAAIDAGRPGEIVEATITGHDGEKLLAAVERGQPATGALTAAPVPAVPAADASSARAA